LPASGRTGTGASQLVPAGRKKENKNSFDFSSEIWYNIPMNDSKQPRRKAMTVRISNELHRRLKILSATVDIPMNELITKLIIQYLNVSKQ
jgi:predicted HicB family RNase H-like nuclease